MSEKEQNKFGALVKAQTSSIQKVPSGLIKRGVEDVLGLVRHDLKIWINFHVLVHTNRVFDVAFSPDGSILASCGDDQSIKLWRTLDWSLVRSIMTQMHSESSIIFSPDGLSLASISGWWEYEPKPSFEVGFWRLSDGSLLRKIDLQTLHSEVAFSPDGSMFALRGGSKNNGLWRLSDGALVRKFSGQTSYSYSIAFRPDGLMVASAEGRSIKLWRVTDGGLVRKIAGQSSYVNSIAFSPDGSMLASRSSDKSIKLWRISDGELIHKINKPSGSDNCCKVTFSPDGSILANGVDENIILWRVSDGCIVHTLTGHTDHVFSVAFSPDGTCLASGGSDKTVRLWNLRTA